MTARFGPRLQASCLTWRAMNVRLKKLGSSLLSVEPTRNPEREDKEQSETTSQAIPV